MVLLSARGYTVRQVAEIFAVGEDVVREWLHRYAREGPTGMDHRPRPGRPPRDRRAPRIVDTQAPQTPSAVGLVAGCLTVRVVGAFPLARFHVGKTVGRGR